MTNKVIKELAEKATEHCCDSGVSAAWAWEKKFTEVIIREVISKISKEQDTACANWQCKNGVHITWELYDYFGIKP